MALTELDKQKMMIALYCINKSRDKDSCIGMECKSGQCLCLDEEQLLMFEQILGIPFCFQADANYGYVKAEGDLSCHYCKHTGQHNKGKELISSVQMEQNELEDKISKFLSEEDKHKWQSFIHNLPLIQSVNKLYEIAGRETVAYWIVFGDYEGEFLKKLLLQFLCCAVNDYLEGKSLKPLSKCIDRIFKNLRRLYQKKTFQKNCNKILESIEQYAETIDKTNEKLHPCKLILREFYEQIECDKEGWEKKDVLHYILRDKEAKIDELKSVYVLLSIAMQVMGEKSRSNADNFMKPKTRGVKRHKIYGGAIEVLESVRKKSEQEKKEVLCDVVALLCRSDECTNEEMQKFREKYL